MIGYKRLPQHAARQGRQAAAVVVAGDFRFAEISYRAEK